jgi:hypothetical protein
MFYIILEKDLATDLVRVYSVFEDEQSAVDLMDQLINSTEDYGYRMDIAPAG